VKRADRELEGRRRGEGRPCGPSPDAKRDYRNQAKAEVLRRSDNFPRVDEHSVKLTVWSASVSGDELATRAGVEPDDRWNQGDVAPGGRPHKRSGVRFGSGLPDETDATEQVSALLARLAVHAAGIGALAAAPETEVTLSIGYFINGPQWQEHDEGALVRGLGVALNSAHVELLHAMRANFDVDIYVNPEAD
jgi:hypothetical protein